MNQSLIYKVSSILCLFVSTNCIYAWGWAGHVLTAKIAQLELTDKTKAEIKKIGFDNIGTREVAAWADQIRFVPQYRHCAPWHFIDLPIGETQGIDDVNVYIERHPENVVNKINFFSKRINDNKLSIEDRQEALKFLVHFVGDIHQPLHCSNNNDRGGNSVKVKLPNGTGGKRLNLHHVFDTNLVLQACGSNKPNLDEVAKEWYDELRDNDIDDIIEVMQPNAWAFESHLKARNFAYKNLPASHRLTEEYMKDGSVIIKQRIQYGGIRLATLLNNIFDGDN